MTTPDGNQPTYAAGWYADVNAPGTERWYDGSSWTEHTRPIAALSAPAAQDAAAAAAAAAAETVAGRPVDATGAAAKRPWFKRKGIVIPVAVVGGLIVLSSLGSALGGGRDNTAVVADDDRVASQPADETPAAPKPEEPVEPVVVAVPNVVGMNGSDAQSTLSGLGFKVDTGGGDLTMPVTAQDIAADAQAEEGSTVRLTLQEKPKLSLAQENAVRSAEQYLSFTAFSRAGLVQQLSSEYGEGFAPEDAEFAVATLEQTGKVDWNAEAAESAQSYLDMTSFSRDGLYEQLTSEYGEGFTPEQANAGLAAVGY